ncbi:cytochrome C heme lyase subunit nrfG nitrite reductase complex assembly [Vibrio mimicus CAIM 1883]|nr:cytochrome C heme lyase subunit nrfG nitrite reductase complex assembly [Vibrio mimicus CAIM 1882]ERM59368.1 cytochrome C heme lyase subunit nrfG nitrite reductase complex assembly [Vibrio mimicus CAIM 1883]
MDGMTLTLGVAVVVAMAIYLLIRTQRRVAVGFVGIVTMASVGLFLWMQQPEPKAQVKAETKSLTQTMSDLQEALREDPNQADLWFSLGQGYLLESDFPAATQCFDYAIRLTEFPTANQYAAKATALYYQHKQNMNDEVTQLLNTALEIEPFNETALTLIAQDHMISFRYQQAVETWLHLLDSPDLALDRAKIIQQLDLAKSRVVKAS